VQCSMGKATRKIQVFGALGMAGRTKGATTPAG
jgi:hypothetical protein